MTDLLTLDAFRKSLPRENRSLANDELIKYMNDLIAAHPEESMGENFMSYTSVLKEGRFKIREYLNAVRYVGLKIMGNSQMASYTMVFPERYQHMVDKEMSNRNMASYVNGYNKSKLVNLILAQTMVPSYILNADLYQKALNVSAELMMNARSEKVRADAANNIMNQLKVPEAVKVEMDIKVSEDGAIDELKQSTLELVRQQRLMIESGAMSAKTIAHSKIVNEQVIEGEVIN